MSVCGVCFVVFDDKVSMANWDTATGITLAMELMKWVVI